MLWQQRKMVYWFLVLGVAYGTLTCDTTKDKLERELIFSLFSASGSQSKQNAPLTCENPQCLSYMSSFKTVQPSSMFYKKIKNLSMIYVVLKG